jgi:hypothetical protein
MEFCVILRNKFVQFCLLGSIGLVLTQNALAQEDDDDWFDEDVDTEDSKRSDDEKDDFDLDADPDEENIGNEQGDGLNLGEEYDAVKIRGEGEDDADIYRSFKDGLERLGPAEEAISWQEYLEDYPSSIFRPAIEERLEKLEAELYDERIEDRYRNQGSDGTAEIKMVQPVSLLNIDPRQKLHVQFNMGLPGYLGLILDYEHQLKRELSVHGGVNSKSYGGQSFFSFEPGVKYAFIKSARLQMISTAQMDLILGSNLAARPVLGFAKRFELPKDMNLDTMVQVGSEVVLSPSFDPHIIGGFQVAFAPSDTVSFYLETNVDMKDITWENGDAFAFNTLTFGLKFFDSKKGNDRYEVGMGASLPYYYKYWRQHYGAVAGDVNLYFD